MLNTRNNNNWNKGYTMGNYVYEYGNYDATRGMYKGSSSGVGSFDAEEKAYWKAYFAKKYNGKF